MASKRFEIDAALNASGVVKGATDAERALKDLEDQVGDSAKGGARDLDDLEDALKDVQRESRNTGRDLVDDLRDVERQAERTENAVDDVGTGGRKSFKDMGEGAGELSQEIGSNLSEAVSSFRGDLADLGQVGQDTLGGLAGTLTATGPAGVAGAAALAAGAVGLGLVTAEIEKQNERVQKLKEYFSDAWKTAVEGGKEYIDAATVIGEQNSIMFDPDRAEEYKQIQADAKALGLDTQTVLQAAAGDETALQVVMAKSNDLLAEKKSLYDDIEAGFNYDTETQQVSVQVDAVQRLVDRYREIGDVNDENKQKAADAAKFTSDYLLGLVGDAESAKVSVDELGNKMFQLPDGQTIYIDAETGQASLDLETFEDDADGVIDKLNAKDIKLSVDASTSAAQKAINRFVSQNNGRTIKINGRFVTPQGWDG